MTGVESRLFAAQALLAEGWADNVLFNFGTDGTILSATPDVTKNGLPTARGPVLPGMLDVHSHAFQRGLAGQTERAGPDNDSFWTWREAMYGLVESMDAGRMKELCRSAFMEMRRAGVTTVGEFHYLHHRTCECNWPREGV